jgi:hypothetical protein
MLQVPKTTGIRPASLSKTFVAVHPSVLNTASAMIVSFRERFGLFGLRSERITHVWLGSELAADGIDHSSKAAPTPAIASPGAAGRPLFADDDS